MKILLVDDHALFRDGVSLLIERRFAGVELLHAGTLAQAAALLARHADVDLVLLDLALPDSGGLDGLERLHASVPHVRVVVLSADDTPATVQSAIEQGACGFIPKTAQGSELETALRTVLDGAVFVPRDIRDRMRASSAPAAPPLDLTPRQLDVLRLLIEGAPNKVICRQLDVAPSTVKTHVAEIFRKLDVGNRTQAVFAVARLGLRLPR